MRVRTDDTISAIATPAGEGALAIVRISGVDALAIADRVFRGRSPLSTARGFTVHYGRARTAENRPIDEVLATVFRAPRSYTGEDMIELSCHGGLLTPASVLEAVLLAGARLADPGEFTRRAFLNGRIDLARAEAVADLIAARSRRGQMISLGQLEGKLSSRVADLRSSLVDICSLLELELDFSEEGLDLLNRRELGGRLTQLRSEISTLALSYSAGRIAREGVVAVLAGKPNAGKSSLFNALLREQRAIVTPVPGTTRDTLEESLIIDGILFRLIDTAGLREGLDAVEREGVSRTHNAVNGADMIILVCDLTRETFDRALVDGPKVREGQILILAGNKIDLLEDRIPEVSERAGRSGVAVVLSALTGQGVSSLAAAMGKSVQEGVGDLESGVAVTNLRHFNALDGAAAILGGAESALERGEPNEVISYEIRTAAGRLSEITGEITSEEVLNSIFSRFCIGK
jgi:tRNA modification GTPase